MQCKQLVLKKKLLKVAEEQRKEEALYLTSAKPSLSLGWVLGVGTHCRCC